MEPQTFIIIKSEFQGKTNTKVEIYDPAYHGKNPTPHQVYHIEKSLPSGSTLVPKTVSQELVTTDKYRVTNAKRFGVIYTLES